MLACPGSKIYQFADDFKLRRIIRDDIIDVSALQNDIFGIIAGFSKWLLELNYDKCQSCYSL